MPITSVERGGAARSEGEHDTTPSATTSAATRRVTAHLPRPCGSCRSRKSACCGAPGPATGTRSEEHTSELQSLTNLVCRLLLEKKKHRTEYLQSRDKMLDNCVTDAT